MEKILKPTTVAEKRIRRADHLIYKAFPLVGDKRILLQSIVEIKKAVTCCITSILQQEYLYKRIRLYKNPKSNFKTFAERCSKDYNITKEEIDSILELFELAKKHEESPMEFIKEGKIIILSNNMESKTLTLEKAKKFLNVSRSILVKTLTKIK